MARMKATSAGPLGSFADDTCPYNPILTNANTTEYLQTVGHADLFTDTEGNWWSVALSTRNGSANFPMGRETGLVPVVWEAGQWPVFAGSKPGRMRVNMTGPLPPSSPPISPSDGGNIVGQPQKVSFSPGTAIPRQFVYYHFPEPSDYVVSPPDHLNTLALRGQAVNLTQPAFDPANPAFQSSPVTYVARRQDHVLFSAESTIVFSPELDGEEAGMSVFLNRAQHFDFGVAGLSNSTTGSVQRFIRLLAVNPNSSNAGSTDPISKPGVLPLPQTSAPIRLRIEASTRSTYTFSYNLLDNAGRDVEDPWTLVGSGDATEVSGGFTGTLVGMYATGNGRKSSATAYFSDFEYTPVQGVF